MLIFYRFVDSRTIIDGKSNHTLPTDISHTSEIESHSSYSSVDDYPQSNASSFEEQSYDVINRQIIPSISMISNSSDFAYHVASQDSNSCPLLSRKSQKCYPQNVKNVKPFDLNANTSDKMIFVPLSMVRSMISNGSFDNISSHKSGKSIKKYSET